MPGDACRHRRRYFNRLAPPPFLELVPRVRPRRRRCYAQPVRGGTSLQAQRSSRQRRPELDGLDEQQLQRTCDVALQLRPRLRSCYHLKDIICLC